MKGAGARIVFVDSYFAPELSRVNMLPKGIQVQGLGQAIAAGEHRVSDQLGRYLDIDRDPFCALNTSFIEDGAFVHVNRGVVVAEPIHLLFVSTAGSEPAMTHPRNLVVVEEEGQASIVEEYVSWGAEEPTLSNAVTELIAGENAIVAHTLIEREHLQTFNFSTLRIQQARSANVASHSLLVGGALAAHWCGITYTRCLPGKVRSALSMAFLWAAATSILTITCSWSMPARTAPADSSITAS
jgi:Fe-S cluster assembly protein SufD